MAKINRYTGNYKPFGANSQGTERTIFEAPGATDTQSDALDANINTDYLRGWGDNVVSPSQHPTRQQFNAGMFTLGQSLAYLHQQGVAEWDSLQEFGLNAITTRNSQLFMSKTDQTGGNVGNDPESDSLNWRQIAPVVFETVSEMKLSALNPGAVATTSGYYSFGDGGGGTYVVSGPSAVDGLGDHLISNGNTAVLQKTNAVNVLQYGAVRDGVTDDSPSIQAALNAVGTVILEGGRFGISSLTIGAGSKLLSDRTGSIVCVSASSTAITIDCGNLGAEISGFLEIDASGDKPSSYLVRINNSSENVIISGNHFLNTGGNINGPLTIIEHRDLVKRVLIRSNTFSECADAIRVNRGASKIQIEENLFYGYGLRGVYVLGSSAGTTSHVRIYNNEFYTPAAGDIKQPIAIEGSINEVQYITIDSNLLDGPGLPYDGGNPTSNTATADQISVHGARYFSVRANTSIGGGDVGITVSQGSNDGLVSNNIVNASDTAGIVIGSPDGARSDRIHVADNVVINSGQNRDAAHSDQARVGIWVENTDKASLSNNLVYDNQVTKTMKYGLRITDSTNIKRGDVIVSGQELDKILYTGANSFEDPDSYKAKITTSLSLINLEIFSGAITVSSSYHRVDSESASATDDLDTINGGSDGCRVIIRPVTNSHVITVKNGTGNINLSRTGADIVLANKETCIELIYDQGLGLWLEV